MTDEEIVELLKKGEIIAFPTDTVYGLIALPTEENAKKIYELKNRDRNRPIGLFLPEKETLEQFISINFNEEIEKIASFWPGAITLVLPVKESVFPFLQKNGKIGFRIPHSPLLLEVLKKTGPLLQTSANISGKPTPDTSREIESIFNNRVFVVEGKSGNLSSTVLEYQDNSWIVLRKGNVPIVKIRKETHAQIFCDEFNLLFLCTGNIERSPMAEAIARTIFKDLPVNTRSRGTFPGGAPYSSMAQKAVESLGYKKIEGRSKEISEEDIRWADLVLVMEKKHIEFIEGNFPQFKDKVFLLSDDDIPDPVGLGEKTHLLVAKIIESSIKTRWLDFIKSFFKQKRGKA